MYVILSTIFIFSCNHNYSILYYTNNITMPCRTSGLARWRMFVYSIPRVSRRVDIYKPVPPLPCFIPYNLVVQEASYVYMMLTFNNYIVRSCFRLLPLPCKGYYLYHGCWDWRPQYTISQYIFFINLLQQKKNFPQVH